MVKGYDLTNFYRNARVKITKTMDETSLLRNKKGELIYSGKPIKLEEHTNYHLHIVLNKEEEGENELNDSDFVFIHEKITSLEHKWETARFNETLHNKSDCLLIIASTDKELLRFNRDMNDPEDLWDINNQDIYKICKSFIKAYVKTNIIDEVLIKPLDWEYFELYSQSKKEKIYTSYKVDIKGNIAIYYPKPYNKYELKYELY